MLRDIRVNAIGYTPKITFFEGREHLVVPVVALVEGVVHAMNATEPEFVAASQFTKQPAGWNGRPLFEGHPMREGAPVSGNMPEVLAKQRVGTVFNAGTKAGKLVMEAWIDIARCASIAPRLLERARAGDPIEISIGAFVDTDDSTGTWQGKKYRGAWKDLTPDHLALLPEGVEGACSRTMGCGVRAASQWQGELEDLIGNGSNQYVVKGAKGEATVTKAGAEHRVVHTDAHGKSHTTVHGTAAEARMHASRVTGGTPSGYQTNEGDDVEVLVGNGNNQYTHNATAAVASSNKAYSASEKANASGKPADHAAAAIAHGKAAAAHFDAADMEQGATSSQSNTHFGAAVAHYKSSVDHGGKAGGKKMKANAAEGVDVDEDFKTLRDIPQAERDKLSDGDFAGPNRSFPIQEPADVSAAASALGRAKGDRNAIKRKIVAIAYRKGDAFVAALPDDWKRKSDMKNASVFAKFMETARAFFRVSQDANEMSDNDLRKRLFDALQAVEPNVLNVEAYHPVTDPTHVVYTTWEPSDATGVEMGMGYKTCCYERAFTLDANGVVNLGDARIEVQRVSSYEPVEGAEPETLTENTEGAKPPVKNAEQGAPCSCKHKAAPITLSREEEDMNEKEIAAFIKTATPEQLKALGLAKVEEKKEEPKVAEAKVETPKVEAPKEEPKVAAAAPTFDQLLATASPEMQDSIKSGLKIAADKKAGTIKALKDSGRCPFKDEELNAKSQTELDALVQLAGVKAAGAVDFGGQGAPRSADQTEVPAAPDLGERIRAARAAAKK